jgi:hypothetical protein
VIEEMNVQDSLVTGVRKRFFDDGTLYTEQNYDTTGTLNGVAKMFFENGNKAATGSYKAGKKEGFFEFFNPDGTPDFSFTVLGGEMPKVSLDERQALVLQDFQQLIEGVLPTQELQ